MLTLVLGQLLQDLSNDLADALQGLQVILGLVKGLGALLQLLTVYGGGMAEVLENLPDDDL